MKNYVQKGDILDLIAPSGGVVSGVGYLIGTSILAFAQASAAVGETFAGLTEGVINADKLTTDVMAVGAKVNWDDTAKEFKNASGDLDGAATVVEAAGNGDTTVKVKLSPV
jgi:predicted RecA/RadA family phage recombinase